MTNIFVNRRTPGKISNIELDATITQKHTMMSEITSFTVEDGSEASDNIRNLPRELDLTCIITNSPLPETLKERFTFNKKHNYAEEALEQLEDLWKKREPVDVVETSLRIYEDMAIKNITVDRDATTGDALNFTVSFKEFKTTTLTTTDIKNVADLNGEAPGVKPQASTKKKVGLQPTKTVQTSTAKKLFTPIKKFFGGK